MIQFHFKRLLADKEFREKRTITLIEIAEETGISRVTLSKIANSRGDYNTTSDNIEKLCLYFECTPNDLMAIVPEKTEGEKRKGKK
jgi:DNA-binding Xre family transcriptional regulator